MGGKPRAKKPTTYDDLLTGWDRLNVGNEFWEVRRRLHPNHKTKEFRMAITKFSEQRITRGVNKGGHRVTLTIEYIDDQDLERNKNGR